MGNKYLQILKNDFTIYRFNVNESIPDKVYISKYFWIGKTNEELSIVCESNILIDNVQSNSNWSIIKIFGKLNFSLVGILAEISNALKNAEISIIALSTYDTDYFMLKKDKLKEAKIALENIGYKFKKQPNLQNLKSCLLTVCLQFWIN